MKPTPLPFLSLRARPRPSAGPITNKRSSRTPAAIHPVLLRWSAGLLTAFSLAAVCLSGPTLLAQNDSSEVLSNAMFEAATAVLSNATAQAAELVSTNEGLSTNLSQADEESNAVPAVIDTNNLPRSIQPGPSESRRQWMLRQRAGAAGTNLPENAAGKNPSTNAGSAEFRPLKPDYSTFKLVTERNIFDPNRQPHHKFGSSTKPKSVDSFALVGVMSYDKGTFAFFDGSSSDYRKAVKLSDSIAGFKVTTITPNTIQLAAGTNQVELHVGMQLRREEGGDWIASSQAEAYAANASPSAGSNTDSTSVSSTGGGTDTDVLERLRKRREQE
ncbi:MAG TPA: hypothetical protein VHI52_11845 [Verrucomicrobiae bacterium]|nr:hypothetical protein [Verrucomicrobiae bacterium]